MAGAWLCILAGVGTGGLLGLLAGPGAPGRVVEEGSERARDESRPATRTWPSVRGREGSVGERPPGIEIRVQMDGEDGREAPPLLGWELWTRVSSGEPVLTAAGIWDTARSPVLSLDESRGRADAWLVLEGAGWARTSVPLDGDPAASLVVELREGRAAPLEVVNAWDGSVVRGWLWHTEGAFLGTVPSASLHVAAPLPGLVTAAGFRSAAARLVAGVSARMELAPLAEVEGCVAGSPAGVLVFGPREGGAPVHAALEGGGRFRAEGLGAGRYTVTLVSNTHELFPSPREVTVRPGRNRLEDLAARELRVLRLAPAGASLEEIGEVCLWLVREGVPAPVDEVAWWPVRTGVPRPDGIVELRGIRPIAMEGSVWTSGGHAARLPALDAGSWHGGVGAVTVALDPPGTLELLLPVSVHGAQAWVTAHDPGFSCGRGMLRLTERGLFTSRALRRRVRMEPSVVVEPVWPGSCRVALLDADGHPIVEREISIPPGARAVLDLRGEGWAWPLTVVPQAVREGQACWVALAGEAGPSRVLRGVTGGELAVSFLPPGRYRLRAWTDGDRVMEAGTGVVVELGAAAVRAVVPVERR